MSHSEGALEAPQRPLISVIMPAYNVESTIGAAISSILSTDYPNVEVVVCDDGSDDATAVIARAHAEASLPGRRVKVLSQENRGLSAARNVAMDEAQGQYFALCDADDLYMPPHLSAAMDVMEQREAAGTSRVFVDCNAYLLTPGGIHPSRRLLREALPPPDEQRSAMLENNFVSYFTLFPRMMVEEVGGFYEPFRCCEDWDMWARAVYAGWTVARQPVPHALYRWSGGSLSTDRSYMYATEDEVIRRIIRSGGLDAAEYAKAIRRLEFGSPLGMVSDAQQALREGDLRSARTLFVAASSLVPRQRRVAVKAAIARAPGGTRWLRRRQAVIDRLIQYKPEIRR